MKSQSWIASVAIASMAAFGSLDAVASIVPFDVKPISFQVGPGYGTGSTHLDVTFTMTGVEQFFSLANPGDSRSFTFGTVAFNQTGSINSAQLNNIAVSAVFQFIDPFIGLRAVTATGTATLGIVNDLAIDYVINWTPTVVSFGDGGLFTLSMNDLAFNQSGQTRTETATIVLNSAPEPTTLALAALSLAGLAASRRRA